MSLAQCKSSKRYVDKHREHYNKMARANYQKNKKRDLARCHKRTREITEGARRWRKLIGSSYWGLKRTGYRQEGLKYGKETAYTGR